MESVTISPKFQVVIPQKIRKMLGVKLGKKMRVIAYDNRWFSSRSDPLLRRGDH